jgi:hypothetical protein
VHWVGFCSLGPFPRRMLITVPHPGADMWARVVGLYARGRHCPYMVALTPGSHCHILCLPPWSLAMEIGRRTCDTPGVSFMLRREIYPNIGCSVKISISLSHLPPFIKLLMKVSPSLELFDLKKGRNWSLLKLLLPGTNANSMINLDL